MDHKPNRRLRKLSNKEFAEDIKKYIRSSHEFYELKTPELKTLAKRLNQEYRLKDFYKVFKRLWDSGHIEERMLGINAMALYKEDYDPETWRFFKRMMDDISRSGLSEIISERILSQIFRKNNNLKTELYRLGNSKDSELRRIALIASLGLVKDKDIKLPVSLCCINMYQKNEKLQKSVGNLLKEIGEVEPETLKSIVLKNIHMPEITFNKATENMKEIKNLRNIKPFKEHNVLKLGKIKELFLLK